MKREEAKQSPEEHHLLAFNKILQLRITHEIWKRNKRRMTVFYNVCNSLLSSQIPSSHKADKLLWHHVSGTPGPLERNNY